MKFVFHVGNINTILLVLIPTFFFDDKIFNECYSMFNKLRVEH